MVILEVGKQDDFQMRNIADTLASSKKVVVITGAGISTSCGIPVSVFGCYFAAFWIMTIEFEC